MPGVKYGKSRSGKKTTSTSDGDSLIPLAAAAEESLIPASSSWSDLWAGMPAYEMGNTEAFRKVTIHFRDAEEVEAFGKLVGIDMTARTETIWFTPPENYIAPKELIYADDERRQPRYPIYIPSVGRWDDARTANALKAIGVRFRVVVEPSQFDNYAETLGAENLLVLPEDYSKNNTGSIPARNFIWEHALAEGHQRHWVIDDNVRGFLRLHRNRRIPVSGPAIFLAAEDFTDRYENVAFSGFNYMYLAPDRGELPPFYLNTRVYSMILVNNAIPHRWRGRYNEDTDICLRALKDGLCTILFNAFLGDKAPTLTMKGGNTDTVYATGDKRLEFAKSLERQHPDVAKVVWRYGRWHHDVDYTPFAANRLIERKNPPLAGGEYGMKLVREYRDARYPTAPVGTVVLAAKKKGSDNGSEQRDGEEGRRDTQKIRSEGESRGIDGGAGASPGEQVVPRDALVDQAVPAPVTLGVRRSVAAPVVAAAPVTLGARKSPVVDIDSVWTKPPPKVPLGNPFFAFHRALLDEASGEPLIFDDDKWNWEDKSATGVDVECFPNFFLVCFKRFSDGTRIAFEKSARVELDVENLRRVMSTVRLISFNGAAYDLPMIAAALAGKSLTDLKEMTNRIIRTGMRPWETEREFGTSYKFRVDHVDLLEPNPSIRSGLKLLAARLHARFLVDLPFDPDAVLSPEEMNRTTLYCMNDLDYTHILFDTLAEAYELRRALSNEYKTDLRSKSDAQIGETIVKLRVEATTGRRLFKPDPRLRTFKYNPPEFLKFENELLAGILASLRVTEFTVDEAGTVTPPKFLQNLKIDLGESTYSMGIGGLHSTEGTRAVLADEEHALEDIDVASQYPAIILKLGLFPEAIGPEFIPVYRGIVEERLRAKAEKNKVKAEGLKIATNGVYGKFGSPFSFLYAPHLMIATTLTGQLSLLMLIERLEAIGAKVVSGNTDGVAVLFPRASRARLDAVIAGWETETAFTTERVAYKALYNSSVNTYIAIKEDGKVKRKGPVADPHTEEERPGAKLTKNPQMTICSKAVVDLALRGTPIEETIRACRDPRMLVTIVQVKTGGAWRNVPLGRVVRYYWSTDGDEIVYVKDGRRVAKTEGSKPLMELTTEVPADVDWNRYIEEARKLSYDLAIGEH